MRVALVVLIAVTTTACPGDDDSGDPPSIVALDNLESAFASAYCEYLTRCGFHPDEATCLSANLPHFSEAVSFDLDPDLVAAIKAGRVVYDGARVKACFAAVAANSCDTTDADGRNMYQRCWNFLSGTVGGGQPCFLDQECVSQQCSGSSTEPQCIAGTCIGDTPPATQPASLGMPCTFNPGCAGSYCSTTTNMCEPLKGEGEDCIGGDECAVGLGCAGAGPPRVCKPLPARDEPCPDGTCRDAGTYCVAGTCEAYGLSGDSCVGGYLCAPAYPCETTSMTCRRGPGVGQPCSSSSSLLCFDAGTVCDSTTFTCITPKPDGATCGNDADCASGYCSLGTGMCAAQPMCF